MRILVWTVAVFALVLGWAPPAMAHAQLLGTDPDHGDLVDEAPDRLTLTFNEPVRIIEGGFALTGFDGSELPGVAATDGANVVFTPDGEIPEGSTVLVWQVISEDGHVISGELIFHVGERTGPPEVELATSTTIWTAVGNALMYLGLILGTGLALFAVHIYPRGAADRRMGRIVVGLLLIGLVGLIVTLATKAAVGGTFELDNLPPSGLLSAILTLVGIGMVSWRLPGRDRSLTTAGALLILFALALVGHTRTFGITWAMIGTDLVHTSSGAVWAGGLLGIALVSRIDATSATPVITKRFSVIAGWCLAAVVLSGAVLSLVTLGSWSSLTTTSHGRLTLVKLGLVVVAALVGAVNRYRLLPRLKDSAVGLVRRLAESTTVEVVALSVLLVVTAVLVQQDPRAGQTADPSTAQGPIQTQVGPYGLTLDFDPAAAGVNEVEITVHDSDGAAATLSDPPRIRIAGPAGESTTYDATTADGVNSATVNIPAEGIWTIEVLVRTDTFTESSAGLILNTATRRILPETDGMVVSGAMMTPPLQTDGNSGVYMTITTGVNDELTGASSPVCGEVTLHESVIDDAGIASMEPRSSIPTEAGIPLVLASGSLHLMCEGIDPGVGIGDQVPFAVTTARGLSVNVVVEVVDYADLLQ